MDSLTKTRLNNYLNEYYNILDIYYTANKLKINADKNKLLLIYKKKYANLFNNFYFNAKGYKIKPSNTITILGVYLRSHLKLYTQINKLCANLHKRLHELRKLNKFTSFETILLFIKLFVIGKLVYAMPLYLNCSVNNIKTLHKIIMSAARTAIGSYCYRKSISYIFNKCKLFDAKNVDCFFLFLSIS